MIYMYAFTSKKYAFFDDDSFSHAFFLFPLPPFLSLSHTHIHTHTHTLARFLALHCFMHAFNSRVLIQLIASLAIAPRLRTSRLLSLLHSLVCLHTFAAVVTRSEAALVHPREQTHRFVVISINKEIPIQGRTLAYPMR